MVFDMDKCRWVVLLRQWVYIGGSKNWRACCLVWAFQNFKPSAWCSSGGWEMECFKLNISCSFRIGVLHVKKKGGSVDLPFCHRRNLCSPKASSGCSVSKTNGEEVSPPEAGCRLLGPDELHSCCLLLPASLTSGFINASTFPLDYFLFHFILFGF